MFSIAMAIAWEYWRRSWWRNVTGLLIGGAILILLPLHAGFAELVASGSFGVVIMVVAVIGFVTIELTEYNARRDRLGFPEHLYTKPVSTALMVAVRMSLTISAAIAAYLGLDVLVWMGSGVPLRLLEPVLFLVVFAAWTDAAVWSLSGSAMLQLIGLGVGYTLSVGLYAEHIANPEATSAGRWETLRLLSFLPATALAYAIAAVGVRYDRQGRRLSLAAIVTWMANRVYTFRRSSQPFRSASAAQFWIEWQRKGLVLPALNLLALLGYAGVAILVQDVSLEDGPGFMVGLAFINIWFFPVLMSLVINARDRGDAQEMFWRTRPLSDNALLVARLKVAVASPLVAWAVWLTGLVMIAGLLWATGQSGWIDASPLQMIGWVMRQAEPHGLLYVGGIGLLTWTILGIVGSLHATGYKPAAAVWIGVPVLFALWSVLVHKEILPPEVVDRLDSSLPGALGVFCLLVTIAAYAAALWKRRITPRRGGICLFLYLFFSLLVVLLPTGFGTRPIELG